MRTEEVEGYVALFADMRPELEYVRKRVHQLIEELLAGVGMDTISIESRVKDAKSFKEKLRRPGRAYINPLTDVTDLIGLRIVTYYPDDLDQIEQLLRSEFEIDEINSERKRDLLGDQQFGYLSDHYIVGLNEQRLRLPEWTTARNKVFEVQARTALQHAWAAVDHKMNYKSVDDIPHSIKRKMSMLSAMFELADEQFLWLRNERARLRESYEFQLEDQPTEPLPVDDSLIDAVLSATGFLDKIATALDSSGASYLDYTGEGPADADFRSDLLSLVRRLELTSQQLSAMLSGSNGVDVVDALIRVAEELRYFGSESPYEIVASYLLAVTGRNPMLIGYSEYPQYADAIAAAHRSIQAKVARASNE